MIIYLYSTLLIKFKKLSRLEKINLIDKSNQQDLLNFPCNENEKVMIFETQSSLINDKSLELYKDENLIGTSVSKEKVHTSNINDERLNKTLYNQDFKSFHGSLMDKPLSLNIKNNELESRLCKSLIIESSSHFNPDSYNHHKIRNEANEIFANSLIINGNERLNKDQNLMLNTEKENEIKLDVKLDTEIPSVYVEPRDRITFVNLRTDFEKELAELDNLESTNDANFNQEECVEQKDINIFNTTDYLIKPVVKRTAVIETRPEYTTSTLIQSNKLNEYIIPLSVTSFCSNSSNKHDFKIIENSLINSQNECKNSSKRGSLQFILRSPSSPPPQFPAIGANEINELHQNYTVVRSGDIIEKNGIYYSSDGTIRGYSGTVKKLANSKALNEVFLKQQELEQFREKECENELEKKKANKDYSDNSNLMLVGLNKANESAVPINNSPSNLKNVLCSNKMKQKNSLGNIIANEKKANSSVKTKSNIFKINVENSTVNESLLEKIKLDEELSKKLENRRQIMVNQLNTETKPSLTVSMCSNLHIDTNTNTNQSTFSSHNLLSLQTISCCNSPITNETFAKSSFEKKFDSSNTNIEHYQKLSKNQNQSLSKSSSNSSIELNKSYNQKNGSQTSFVMSAKFKTNLVSNQKLINSKNAHEKSFINGNYLPNEPKPNFSSIAYKNKKTDNLNFAQSNQPFIYTAPQPPHLACLSEFICEPNIVSSSAVPPVAPKNFRNDTLATINKKNQLLNNRENLLESIKRFNVSNLKKIKNDQ